MRKADTVLGTSESEEDSVVATPLENRLVSVEQSTLHNIRFHINEKVVWKKVIATSVGVMESLLSPLIRGDATRTWLYEKPILFTKERGFLEHKKRGKLRKQYLLLLFVRKVLTLARNEVDQRLKSMRAMSPEEEEALLQRLENKPDPQRFLPVLLPGAGSEMGNLALGPRLPDTYPVSTILQSSCGHEVTNTGYYRNKNGENVKWIWCKLCKKDIYKAVEPGSCTHRHVNWVPGKEGKEAVCDNKSCQAVVSNPETYRWGDVGLEPFGDDPSKDEIIFLEQP